MKNERKVAVVGLGYVGLPLAVLAKERGWQVTGYDVNETKVESICAGRSPMKDEALSQKIQQFPIEATTDPSRVQDADVIVIAVPTPVTENNEPDLEPVKSAVKSICPYLQPGQTLVVESTINPGVMDEIVIPLIRSCSSVKPDVDEDSEQALFVAHCPERVNPGDSKWTVDKIPRVIGGYTSRGVERAKNFYESILSAPVKVMASATEAEAVKIMENTFRDINIAFVNEMAKSFDKLGIDIVHVIEGASTKPFSFLAHYPGNGVGGHCISVDPYYMIERGRQAGFDHEFLKLARHINDGMPAYAVELMDKGIEELGLDPKTTPVALLGLAYKKNIDDLRESPALEIRRILEERGTPLRVFDPYAPKLSTVSSLEEALQDAPVVMLATNHDLLVQALTPDALCEADVKLVIDGKNALDCEGMALVGIPYYGIGRRRLPK